MGFFFFGWVFGFFVVVFFLFFFTNCSHISSDVAILSYDMVMSLYDAIISLYDKVMALYDMIISLYDMVMSSCNAITLHNMMSYDVVCLLSDVVNQRKWTVSDIHCLTYSELSHSGISKTGATYISEKLLPMKKSPSVFSVSTNMEWTGKKTKDVFLSWMHPIKDCKSSFKIVPAESKYCSKLQEVCCQLGSATFLILKHG